MSRHFPNHAEVTGKFLNVDRGSADLKSAATVWGLGTSQNISGLDEFIDGVSVCGAPLARHRYLGGSNR